ncbi:hypothetical protein GCM10027289_17600 [Tsukamurella serpentis]
MTRNPEPGTPAVRGDITSPHIGISPGDARRLADERVDVVLHIAGDVSFSRSWDQYLATNVGGTRHALDFARELGARFVYVSTAYAQRAEAPGFVRRDGGPSAYAASKLAAERLVHDSDLPHVVIRPSIVIGDSRTGVIGSHQGIHAFARNLMLGRLPFLPVQPEWVLDTVPVDILADVIAWTVASWPEAGTIWATSGEYSLTARDVVVSCTRGGSQPRFIAPDTYERLIRPAFVDDMPADVVRRIETLVHTCDQLFSREGGFPSSLDTACGVRDWAAVTSAAWAANVAALREQLAEAA